MSSEQVTWDAYTENVAQCSCCGDRPSPTSGYCVPCIHNGCHIDPQELLVEPSCAAWQAGH